MFFPLRRPLRIASNTGTKLGLTLPSKLFESPSRAERPVSRTSGRRRKSAVSPT